MEIISGNRYRLDGNVIVTVIKAINRSKTTFSVEIPGKGIYSVDKDRLMETIPEPNHTNSADRRI